MPTDQLLRVLLGALAPLLPTAVGPPCRGRPRASDYAAIHGILLVLITGMSWRHLDGARIGCSGSTCWRRLGDWAADGLWAVLHERMLTELHRLGLLDWSIASADSTHVRAKRGGEATGPNPTDRGKPGSKHHILTDANGLPLAALVTASNVADSPTLAPLLDAVPPVRGGRGLPRRRPLALCADKGYAGKPCRNACRKRGIVPVISLKRKRGEPGQKEPTDGLGHWRFVIERTNSWLHEYKRLGLRYERKAAIHQAFLTLACAIICLKRLVMAGWHY